MTSSKQWLREHFSDLYVKKAQKEGYPSRAAYKLLEFQRRYSLIQPGMVILDLGSAPGGWSVVANQLTGKNGVVISTDLLPMNDILGVTFIQGDFNDSGLFEQLEKTVAERSKNGRVDLVISDMAPNISGEKSIDQPRSLHLLELAWDCASKLLKPGGSFLAKVFQGPGVEQVVAELRNRFNHVKLCKPKASRARSSEVYVFGEKFRYNAR